MLGTHYSPLADILVKEANIALNEQSNSDKGNEIYCKAHYGKVNQIVH
jgi:hypothetical protein